MKARLIAGAAVAILAGAAQSNAQDRLTAITYSGAWGETINNCILQPFAKLSGLTVVNEPGISSVNLTKLQQQKSRPEIDVAWMDGGNSEQAWEAQLTDAIDPKIVTNVAGLVAEGVYKAKDGKIYGLGTGYYAVGILYNTKEVKEKPTSWWDLWKPAYENRVINPSPAQAIFTPLFLHLNKQLGGSGDNYQPAIDKYKTLKATSFYDATGVVQASIQSGEVIIGAYYVNSAWALADQGLPIAAAAPKEGLPAGDIRVHLVKGTKNKANAEKLINYAVSADGLNCLAEKLYVGPPLKTPTLSPKAKERMPWGADGSIKNLVIPDWDDVNARRPVVTDLWNRNVARK